MAQTSPILQLGNCPLASLIVGLAGITFHIHLNLICEASPVFERTLKGGKGRDAASSSLELIDEDITTVDRFVSWLYSGRYKLSDFYTENTSHSRFRELADLNIFADKYEVVALSNDIIDRLWHPWDLYLANIISSRTIFCPRVSLVRYVYENTSRESAFRSLLVDWYVWEIPLTWYDDQRTREELCDVSQDFAVDLAVALARRLAFPYRKSPFAMPKRAYYEELQKDSGNDEGVDLKSYIRY